MPKGEPGKRGRPKGTGLRKDGKLCIACGAPLRTRQDVYCSLACRKRPPTVCHAKDCTNLLKRHQDMFCSIRCRDTNRDMSHHPWKHGKLMPTWSLT